MPIRKAEIEGGNTPKKQQDKLDNYYERYKLYRDIGFKHGDAADSARKWVGLPDQPVSGWARDKWFKERK